MVIFCTQCEKEVKAEKVFGKKVYPHRDDLHSLIFYECQSCLNFVGCHKGTEKPLGVIADKKLKVARQKIHSILDPLWKEGKMTRKNVYKRLSKFIGKEYHTAELRSAEEAEAVYMFILKM